MSPQSFRANICCTVLRSDRRPAGRKSDLLSLRRCIRLAGQEARRVPRSGRPGADHELGVVYRRIAGSLLASRSLFRAGGHTFRKDASDCASIASQSSQTFEHRLPCFRKERWLPANAVQGYLAVSQVMSNFSWRKVQIGFVPRRKKKLLHLQRGQSSPFWRPTFPPRKTPSTATLEAGVFWRSDLAR
jgi:hypothetical protein